MKLNLHKIELLLCKMPLKIFYHLVLFSVLINLKQRKKIIINIYETMKKIWFKKKLSCVFLVFYQNYIPIFLNLEKDFHEFYQKY